MFAWKLKFMSLTVSCSMLGKETLEKVVKYV